MINTIRKNIELFYSECEEYSTLWDDSDIDNFEYWRIFQINDKEINESDKIGCLLIILSMCICEIQNIARYDGFNPCEIFQILSSVGYDVESRSVKELIDINKMWLRIHYERSFGFTMEEIQALEKMKKYVFNKFIRASLQGNTTL